MASGKAGVDFGEAGVISLQSPPEKLKPFFRKKFLLHCRQYEAYNKGFFNRSDVHKKVEQMGKKLSKDEKEELMSLWDFIVMGSLPQNIVSEEEHVDAWMSRVWSDPDERRKYMERTRKCAGTFFYPMDLNKDGVVDLSEWREGAKKSGLFDDNTVKRMFEEIDKNKNGVISLDEWSYAVVYFRFCSNPDELLSYLFNPREKFT